ncbi:7874_t:CDS:2, partial [Diversispora eburnea]
MSGHQDVRAKAIQQLWDRGIQTAKEIQRRTVLVTEIVVVALEKSLPEAQVFSQTSLARNRLEELGYSSR